MVAGVTQNHDDSNTDEDLAKNTCKHNRHQCTCTYSVGAGSNIGYRHPAPTTQAQTEPNIQSSSNCLLQAEDAENQHHRFFSC